jgi:hypothetical protein
MSLRVYAGPTEFIEGEHRAVVARYVTNHANLYWPVGLDGQPASTWVLTMCRATDWSLADADTRLINLFGPELNGTEETRDDFIAALSAKTLSQVGATRADAIKARLDALGVPYADFTGSTTMWELFNRLLGILATRDYKWGRRWQV